MWKINSIIFDQDYSARWVISRWTLWAWIGFFAEIFFNNLEFWVEKFILLWIWVIIFLLWVFLVKTKKKVKFDERIFDIQLKSYTYSWNTWIISLFLGWYILDKKIINLSNLGFAFSVIILMCLVYFVSYIILKNKG